MRLHRFGSCQVILGSWIAFKLIWNITPEVTEKMRAIFEAEKTSAVE